jgi:hypothetical protein
MIFAATSGGKRVLRGVGRLIQRSAWKGYSRNFALTALYSKEFPCENRGKANKRRMPMTLVRVEETDSGSFTVLNLQMVARVKCSGFEESQQGHRASVVFSDGGWWSWSARTPTGC